jgi:hypothetical protein
MEDVIEELHKLLNGLITMSLEKEDVIYEIMLMLEEKENEVAFYRKCNAQLQEELRKAVLGDV